MFHRKNGRWDARWKAIGQTARAYLERAANLKDELAKMPDVVRTERFQSLATEDKLLSLSVWENEEAIETWRNQIDHHMSQAAGRGSIFASYDITALKPLRRLRGSERVSAGPIGQPHPGMKRRKERT